MIRKYIQTKIPIDWDFVLPMLSLAMPIALQNFVASSLNMVDTIMIGQLGQVEIAAVGLANQFFFLFHLLLFGINSGAAIFTAQFWGKKDVGNIRKILGINLGCSLIASMLFSMVSFIFPAVILSIFTVDHAVINLGSSYLRIVAVSYFLNAIAFAYASVLRSTGEVVLPLVISGVAILTNTFFNYILIYGHFGFPELGVDGAAVATMIARLVETVVLVFIVYRWALVPAANFREMLNIPIDYIKKFLKTTIPVIMNEGMWSLGVTMYTVVYARMGTGIIAAVNIASTVERLALVLFFGMAQACAVMVGNQIGSGDEEKAFRYAKRFAFLGPAIGVFISLTILWSSSWITSFYHVNATVIDLTTKLILIFALTIPIRIFNLMMIVGILRSGGDTTFCLIIDTAGLWFIAVPLAFCAGLIWHLPAHLVYLLVASEELFKFCLGIFRLLSKKWINNLTHHLTHLPESFSISAEEEP